jgi:hypothetical protein
MMHKFLVALALATAATLASASAAQENQEAGFEPIARSSTMEEVAEVLLNSIATTSTNTTSTTSTSSSTPPACGCGSR